MDNLRGLFWRFILVTPSRILLAGPLLSSQIHASMSVGCPTGSALCVTELPGVSHPLTFPDALLVTFSVLSILASIIGFVLTCVIGSNQEDERRAAVAVGSCTRLCLAVLGTISCILGLFTQDGTIHLQHRSIVLGLAVATT